MLKNSLDTGELPHLIFSGSPGTGKTSTALALCNILFSPQERKNRVLELNASDERGIDAVRNKIKSFSSLAVQPGPVPFKVIILDEADSMTKDAQNALRRIIEVHSAVTRFIIICNYISKIIDPILSRCARFRFQRLTKESVIKRLEFIAQEENLVIEDQDVFETLFNISNGDMRKAITFLQSASVTGSISSLLLLEISGTPRVDLVSEFVGVCLKQSWGY